MTPRIRKRKLETHNRKIGQGNTTTLGLKQNRQTVRDRGKDKDLNKGKGVIT